MLCSLLSSVMCKRRLGETLLAILWVQAVEREKQSHLKRLREHRADVVRHTEEFEELKGEIDLVRVATAGMLALK